MARDARPKAKAGLLYRPIENELLVHVPEEGITYCLNDSAAHILNECTGEQTTASIRSRVSASLGTPMSDDVLWVGLEELRRRGLIDVQSLAPTRFDGASRRAMLRHIGVAAAMTAPVILGVVAEPTLAQSATCNCAGANGSLSRPHGCSCTQNSQCCSNICGGGGTVCAVASGNSPSAPGCCPVVTCSPANGSNLPDGCACVGNANCSSGVCTNSICAAAVG